VRRETKPLLLGHRGYRALYPENTLRSFREALLAGADGVECDLQRTADGRYVVFHDPGTQRVTGVAGEVGRMNLQELRALDAGRGERIPELSELLGALPPMAFLNLELKTETLSPRDCGPIAELLDARAARSRLLVSSFSPRLLAPFRRRGFTTGLLVGARLAALGAPALLPLLLLARPRFVNLPVDIFVTRGEARGRSTVSFLRSRGLSVLFWTVNSEAEAGWLSGLADIIVSDEVGRMRAILDSGSPPRRNPGRA
jgi:glycerophosphoryl diester phosphodiesterase